MEEFAQALKAARKAAGLTQQDMEDLTTIPKRTIQDWEGKKRVPPPYVQRLVLNELKNNEQNICYQQNDTPYKRIKFLLGSNLCDAVLELLYYQKRGILACGDFNGHMLYSDKVTMDSAYIEVTGMTKAEYDKAVEIQIKGIEIPEK